MKGRNLYSQESEIGEADIPSSPTFIKKEEETLVGKKGGEKHLHQRGAIKKKYSHIVRASPTSRKEQVHGPGIPPEISGGNPFEQG